MYVLYSNNIRQNNIYIYGCSIYEQIYVQSMNIHKIFDLRINVQSMNNNKMFDLRTNIYIFNQ